MATNSYEREYFEFTLGYWAHIVAAGLAAGALMGLLMHYEMGVIRTVGALYGQEATTFGWFFHRWHAVFFGLLFGVFFVAGQLRPFRDRVLASTTIGIAWGTVLWILAAGVVMPVWLGALGRPAPDPVALNPWSGIGHVLYGAVLGGAAALNKYFSPTAGQGST